MKTFVLLVLTFGSGLVVGRLWEFWKDVPIPPAILFTFQPPLACHVDFQCPACLSCDKKFQVVGQALKLRDHKITSIPSAKIMVCQAEADGIPCSPLVPIFQDSEGKLPLPNPFSADSFGNYSFFSSPEITVAVTAPGVVGYSFQVRVR